MPTKMFEGRLLFHMFVGYCGYVLFHNIYKHIIACFKLSDGGTNIPTARFWTASFENMTFVMVVIILLNKMHALISMLFF